ncbi:MAG: integrin alpha, partial [Cyanobacteriota bacterium]
QTASGPIAASQYTGQTYLVYQGGTTGSPSTEIYLATSSAANINNGANWTAQAVSDPGLAANIGLSSSPRGLLLSYDLKSGSGLILTNLSPAGASSEPLDPLQSWIQTGGGAGSLAGYSIDGNVDLNGDGLSDLLISEPAAVLAGDIDKDDPTGRGGTDANAGAQYALFGGDWLGIASKVGTANDDTLVGTPLADVIYSLQGNDQVSSQGGADVIYCGDGDDTIAIIDNAFLRIDGGGGFNSLLLQGKTNQAFDFRLGVSKPQFFSGTKLRNINLINSSGYGNNTLSFDAAAVNALNPARILFLVPDAGDTIALSPGFSRSPDFDASVQGLYWNAFADTSAAGSTASGNPTLIYVLNPLGISGNGWLNTQVTRLATAEAPNVTSTPAAASVTPLRAAAAPVSAPSATAAPAGTTGSDLSSFLPTTSTIADAQPFGNGLSLVAYRIDPSSGVARFAIKRKDSHQSQAVLYASAAANASAKPVLHYAAVVGLFVFELGQTLKEVTVPIHSQAFAALRDASVSLAVEEIAYKHGMENINLLIQPTAPAVGGQSPVMSGLSLSLDSNGNHVNLVFRADTYSDSIDVLKLHIARRETADTVKILQNKIVEIADFNTVSGDPTPTSILQNLDHDFRSNNQVKTSLQLNLIPKVDDFLVSLIGPELVLEQTVQQ